MFNQFMRSLMLPLYDAGEGSGGGVMGLPAEAPTGTSSQTPAPQGTETPGSTAPEPSGTPASEPASQSESQQTDAAQTDAQTQAQTAQRDYQKRYQQAVEWFKSNNPTAWHEYRQQTHPGMSQPQYGQPRDERGRFTPQQAPQMQQQMQQTPGPQMPPANQPEMVNGYDDLFEDPNKFVSTLGGLFQKQVNEALQNYETQRMQRDQQEAWQKLNTDVSAKIREISDGVPRDVIDEAWIRADQMMQQLSGRGLDDVYYGSANGPYHAGYAFTQAMDQILAERNSGLRNAETQQVLAEKAKRGLMATQPGAAAPPNPDAKKSPEMEQLERMQKAGGSDTSVLMEKFGGPR